MFQEARHAHRIPCDIILNKTQDGHKHICRATNISLSGMRIQRLLEPVRQRGERVRLELQLPGHDEPIQVTGKKVYEDDTFVGVRFIHISHQHFVKLRHWISAQPDAPAQIAA